MKKILPIISLIFFTATIHAQRELRIKSGDKGLYLEHTVAAKENFYSIGRLYNVHPKHIASFNGLDMSKGLAISKVIRIPLTDSNFVQSKAQGVPIYYIVGEKESLIKVSNNNNKVLPESLRKWNHLASDNISKDQKLVVGFLSSREMKTTAIMEQPKNSPPKTEDIIKEEAKKKPDEVIETKKEEPKQVIEAPRKNEETIPVKDEPKAIDNSQGYFKSSFLQQAKQKPAKKNLAVTSGIFKTTSGWSDAKYYLLIDGVETGTIVKITNPANNKIIYAKVLGEMNGLAHGDGLDIRISNAAATILDIDDTDKFILKLNY
jgi:hypothetical protein